ncbi:MAG: hypothetical protein AB1486_18840 [Planctomycetota bacterium]
MPAFRMTVREPFSLVETALSHGWHETPPFRYDFATTSLWIAVRVPPSGRALEVRVREVERKDGKVRLEVRVAAVATLPEVARVAVRAAVERCLHTKARLDKFYALCRRYRPLHWAIERQAGRILRGVTVFEDLVKAICGTNITWKQAVRSIHRLCSPLPEPENAIQGLRAFPTAGELLTWGGRHLREHARVGYRAASILELCERVRDADFDIDFPLRDGARGEEVFEWFQTIRGIGPVTAAYLTALYGHHDFLGVDSLGLTYLGNKYHGGRKATIAEANARYERFGRYRMLAYWCEFLGDVDRVSWRPPEPPSSQQKTAGSI